MFPVWLFLVMMSVIVYLLYHTRTAGSMGNSGFKKLQFWMKEASERKLRFPTK